MLQLDFLPHTLSHTLATHSLPAGLVQGLKDCISKMELLKGQEHYSLHVQDYIQISVSSLGFTVLIMYEKNSHLFLQCAPKRICSFVSRHPKGCLSIKAWHMWSGKGLLLHAPASCSEIPVLKPSRCKMTAKSGDLYWSWQWIISKHLVCTKATHLLQCITLQTLAVAYTFNWYCWLVVPQVAVITRSKVQSSTNKNFKLFRVSSQFLFSELLGFLVSPSHPRVLMLQTKAYPCNCKEISTIIDLKVNLTMNAVITLWKSPTKCWNISSWIPSSDELPWLPIDFINS